MTFLEQADNLVRNHPANKELMELGFGCEVKRFHSTEPEYFVKVTNGHYELHRPKSCLTYTEPKENEITILGKPPHLEHYLRVLEAQKQPSELQFGDSILRYRKCQTEVYTYVDFNLTTGAPATEKDAESFVKLVS